MGTEFQPAPAPLRIDEDGVCRVAGSRLTLLTLIDAFQEGCTPEEIVQEYPSVSLPEVYAVIAYYLGRQVEMDAYLERAREREAKVIEQIKSRPEQAEIRRRVLARKPVSA